MDDNDREALRSEVAILTELSHPAITFLKEVFDTEKIIFMVHLCLVHALAPLLSTLVLR